jgi:hypothetical protein
MLSLLFGLLSTAGTAVLTVVIAAYARQYLHNLSPAFIPFGAFLLGALCAAGYFGGLFVSGRRTRPIHYIAAAVLGIVGYAGVNYAVYRTAHVDAELSVNHQFHGQHISEFFADGQRERFTWPVFFVREAQRRQPSLAGFTTVMQALPNPPRRSLPLTGGQRALLALEFVAFLAGAVLVGPLVMRDRDYCTLCRRYLKERDLFFVPLEGMEASISRLNEAINLDPDAVLALGRRAPATVRAAHVQVSLRHCLGCGSGFLLLRFIDQALLTGLNERRRDRQTVRLPGRFASDLAERAPSPSR